MLIGGDSITAAKVPLTVDVGFGYLWNQNPAWQSFEPLQRRLSPKKVFGITTSGDHPEGTQFLDVETYAAKPNDFPAYWKTQFPINLRLGLPTGGYGSPGAIDLIVAWANSNRIPRAMYKLWSAHYGKGEHLCGPQTCGACKNPVDGTQWLPDVPPGWDRSILLDSFINPYQVKNGDPEVFMTQNSNTGALSICGNATDNGNLVLVRIDNQNNVQVLDVTAKIHEETPNDPRVYRIS